MKSFEFEKRIIRDTQIPRGEIPLLLLHWLDEYYYGGGLSPLDMRKFLESKLRRGYFERTVVNMWLKQAHNWAFFVEKEKPGHLQEKLQQYHQIKVAA